MALMAGRSKMKHQQVQCLEKAYFPGLHRWKLLDVVSGARHRALILFIMSPHPWPSCCLTTVPGQSSGDQRTITSAIVWCITEGLQYAERPPESLATLSIMCTVLLGFLVIPIASEAQLCLPYPFYLCTVFFFITTHKDSRDVLGSFINWAQKMWSPLLPSRVEPLTAVKKKGIS